MGPDLNCFNWSTRFYIAIILEHIGLLIRSWVMDSIDEVPKLVQYAERRKEFLMLTSLQQRQLQEREASEVNLSLMDPSLPTQRWKRKIKHKILHPLILSYLTWPYYFGKKLESLCECLCKDKREKKWKKIF